ncbi:rod shape-determining protein MreD [Aestuariispira ectoiniformans]|uniref:rod shape-determining protein MreD n=1 Tax=Aestuariispira ectoiniformans TaxID=2775080 RepID=UPI00223B6872|nr:rod shape-determining protein MreD [Aestuariispira ectoiniformans]
MKLDFWSRVDLFARSLTPVLLTLVFIMVQQVSLHIPNFAQVSPLLALISIYYWAIYRPDLMPMLAVFLLGLADDLMSGSVLGVSSFIYLICYALVGAQRRFFYVKGFGIVWWGFMLVAALMIALKWVVVCLLDQNLYSFLPSVFSYLMSLAFFPIMAVILWAAHKTVPQQG